jgi:hypothetical protein
MLYPSTCCICWYRKKYVFKTGKKVNGPHQVHRKDVDPCQAEGHYQERAVTNDLQHQHPMLVK